MTKKLFKESSDPKKNRGHSTLELILILSVAQVFGTLIGTGLAKYINDNINIFASFETFMGFLYEDIMPNLLISLPIGIVVFIFIINWKKRNDKQH